MALKVGTHSGTFHADDVFAFALIRTFVDEDATVLRSRDPLVLHDCDIVIDVGGIFDPASLRFDHHQGSYAGPRSSAGMVLDWLVQSERIDTCVASYLRTSVVDYIDDVDTGRRAPTAEVPCFARIVEAFGLGADSAEEQLDAYLRASDIAAGLVEGLMAGYRRTCEARVAVKAAMARAEASNSSVLEFDRYYPWKVPYFEFGGATHPTFYVVFPSDDGTWKAVAIPPRLGTFDQKRPLPKAWAGKLNEALAAATGVEDAVFCHKNRFVAVFRTREGLFEALRRFGLDRAEPRPASE